VHSTGRAARRLMWTVLALALALACLQPVLAGSADAPEIQDAAGDVSGDPAPVPCTPGTPASGPCAGPGSFADLHAGWVESETATDVVLAIDSANNANAYGGADYDFHFTIAGVDYVAGMHVDQADVQGGVPGDGAVTPTGIASKAEFVDTVITLTIPRTAIAGAGAGAVMTNMFLTSKVTVLDATPQTFTDRAPDDPAFGLDYTMDGGVAGGGNGTGKPGDADGDGLNDTCEKRYFGNLTAQNATGDPDGDGLTNGQECALGTDPTKADTDGDGTNDKDDPYPTDPTRGGTNATSSSSSSSSSSTSSSHSSTTTAAASSHTKGAPKDFGEAMDRLKSDAGYLGLSSGGFLAVLVLCIIGLAVRWSL